MEKKDIDFISECIYRRFLLFMDSNDANLISESILEDVVRDVEECADPKYWNSIDVDIAITRVLKERLGIEL